MYELHSYGAAVLTYVSTRVKNSSWDNLGWKSGRRHTSFRAESQSSKALLDTRCATWSPVYIDAIEKKFIRKTNGGALNFIKFFAVTYRLKFFSLLNEVRN